MQKTSKNLLEGFYPYLYPLVRAPIRLCIDMDIWVLQFRGVLLEVIRVWFRFGDVIWEVIRGTGILPIGKA